MVTHPPNQFGITQEALDACAQEPIHIPGSIQPQGVLLVLVPAGLVIAQVSINSADMIGREPAQVIGQPLDTILASSLVASIQRHLERSTPGTIVAFDAIIQVRGVVRRFHVMAHTYAGLVLVELLPLAGGELPEQDELAALYVPAMLPARGPAAGTDAAYLSRQITSLAANLALDTPLQVFCRHVAEGVRAIAGYDRVMIYRFDEAGNGEVIAEARERSIEPFLGLWYPASDIPPQARLLYLRNRVRALADIYLAPVPLLPQINPHTGNPPDLSFCLLRSFSPVHLEYLHNMGVRATLTVSIIEQGRLWGLIACHQYQPHWPDPDVRAACDMLSEIISIQVTLREYALRAQATLKAQALQHDLIRRMAGRTHWFTALSEEATLLPEMLNADGVAVCSGQRIVTAGTTPTLAEIHLLLAWLQTTVAEKVLITDSLSGLSSAFANLVPTASGLVALEIARQEGNYVLWFRREVIQSVTWGGNPAEKFQAGDDASRLRPRTSFAAWTTEVRGRARAWSGDSRQLAIALRAVLVEVVFNLLAARHTMTSLDLMRVRRAVEALSEPLVVTDLSGTAQLLNPAFSTLTGFDLQTLQEHGGLAALPADPLQAAAVELAVRSAVGHWQGDLEIRIQGGTLVMVQMRVDLVRNELGEPIGQIRLYTDLRPRRQAEEERRRLDARLFEAQKLESLGMLAGGIAHDFNNLLTAMMGHANLLRMDLPSDSPAQEGLDQIELAAQRAAELSRQMLAYAGRGQFVIREIDLSRMVAEMARLLETTIGKTNTLQMQLTEGLPPIRGDVTQVRQVVMNLITNASDAMVDGSGTITLTTRALFADAALLLPFNPFAQLTPGPYVLLEVADTGIGMDTATLARMFEPFFSTKFVGRGLGLAAVQGIVRSHKGSLSVESAPRRGTRIRVLFPVVDPSSAEPEPSSPAQLQGKGQLLLVIDDDAGVRSMMVNVLERNGYQVVAVAGGTAGLAAFAEHHGRLAAVLLDLTMPGMSGNEVLVNLRRVDPVVPVLLCSGYSQEEAMKQFPDSSLTGFVQKPFRTRELLIALQAAIVTPQE